MPRLLVLGWCRRAALRLLRHMGPCDIQGRASTNAFELMTKAFSMHMMHDVTGLGAERTSCMRAELSALSLKARQNIDMASFPSHPAAVQRRRPAPPQQSSGARQ